MLTKMKNHPPGTPPSDCQAEADSYSALLWSDDEQAQEALAYLRARKFTDESIKLFGLGYAKTGFFSGRLTFPIKNEHGIVVGFTGRDVHANGIKYMMSPTTDIFKKSKLVYGLHKNREAIYLADKAYIVEGFTDVIAMNQMGIQNVVAPMGLVLTKSHMAALAHYTSKLVIVLDSDVRGQEAAHKTATLARESGFLVSEFVLPEGKDPADLLK